MAVACFVTFFLSLRNWTLAAHAMFVNVLPVAIVAAILGATGQPIDMATVFIMGISLGIAVDDTSFFVHEYLAARPRGPAALWRALGHTGPSMIATCVVIVIGFSVLLASAFTPMRTFGGMTAVGLVLAMLCDLFVLSFLLVAFSGKPTMDFIYAEDTVLALMLLLRRPPQRHRLLTRGATSRRKRRRAVHVQDAQGRRAR